MRFCVMGWFGHQNRGDERLAEVLTRAFKNHHLTFLPFMEIPPETANWFDGIIFTGGLWHPRNSLARNFRRWSSQIHVPIIPIGLGIEQMTEDLRDGSDALVERCEMIYVRDNISAYLLGENKKIVVGPDITWLYPYALQEKNRSASENIVAFNLRFWQREYWPSLEWVSHVNRLDLPVNPWPLSPGDASLLRQYYRKIPEYFDIEPATKAGIVISMRFHGLVFAAQLGIPAIGLCYDPKCKRWLDEIGKSEWGLSLQEPTKLSDVIQDVIDLQAYERERLSSVRQDYITNTHALVTQAIELFESVSNAKSRNQKNILGRGLIWVGRKIINRGYRIKKS
jgi:polysaccharide pyruvyl transferase WcaK-like protein